jgi:hypothetical protein
VDEWKVKPELLLIEPGVCELGTRVVDGDNPSTETREAEI